MSTDAEHATEALVQLRRRVDAHFTAAVERSPGAFHCRSGCSSCCHHRFGVFEVEATPIREALEHLRLHQPMIRRRVREQAGDEGSRTCAMLVDDRCAIYAVRPIICRSHGLPIAYRDGEHLRIDVCHLNFDQQEEIPNASVMNLDTLERTLSVIARLVSPNAPRIELAALAAAPDAAS